MMLEGQKSPWNDPFLGTKSTRCPCWGPIILKKMIISRENYALLHSTQLGKELQSRNSPRKSNRNFWLPIEALGQKDKIIWKFTKFSIPQVCKDYFSYIFTSQTLYSYFYGTLTIIAVRQKNNYGQRSLFCRDIWFLPAHMKFSVNNYQNVNKNTTFFGGPKIKF